MILSPVHPARLRNTLLKTPVRRSCAEWDTSGTRSTGMGPGSSAGVRALQQAGIRVAGCPGRGSSVPLRCNEQLHSRTCERSQATGRNQDQHAGRPLLVKLRLERGRCQLQW